MGRYLTLIQNLELVTFIEQGHYLKETTKVCQFQIFSNFPTIIFLIVSSLSKFGDSMRRKFSMGVNMIG